jgi:serine/threonine-protein kinase
MHAGSAAGPTIGRYRLAAEIGSGGMASVHLGRLLGPAGFARTVAIKRMSPALARSAEAAAMFLDEARLASRIRHANVVPTLEVVVHEGEVLLVMEYVHGESLGELGCGAAGRGPMPARIAAAVAVSVLEGLHAAHGARGDDGTPLHIVHRDVSPQNVLVGADGLVRVLDFGIAKAASSASITAAGRVKGKLGYMAPEQIEGGAVDARTDVFAVGVLLWEMLTGARLFPGEQRLTAYAARQRPPPPSTVQSDVGAALDAVVLRAMEVERGARFESAHAMAAAIEAAAPPAGAREVGGWLAGVASESLDRRAALIAAVERGTAAWVGAADVADLPTDVGLPSADAAPSLRVEAPPPAPLLAPNAWTRSTRAPARSGLAIAAGAAALALAIVWLSSAAEDAGAGVARTALASWVARNAMPPPDAPAEPASIAQRAAETEGRPASLPAEPTVSAAHARARPAITAPSAPVASVRAPSCKPAYTIGDDGIRRFKPWCVPGAQQAP